MVVVVVVVVADVMVEMVVMVVRMVVVVVVVVHHGDVTIITRTVTLKSTVKTSGKNVSLHIKCILKMCTSPLLLLDMMLSVLIRLQLLTPLHLNRFSRSCMLLLVSHLKLL